jgi:hypothetical protein
MKEEGKLDISSFSCGPGQKAGSNNGCRTSAFENGRRNMHREEEKYEGKEVLLWSVPVKY